MITNSTQLEVALHQLTSFREMLEAMRLHLEETNPSLFPTVSESYLTKIKELEDEVIEYLRERPVDAPLLIRIAGPQIKHGVIRANLASQLISGLQSALYQVGGQFRLATPMMEEFPARGLRKLLELNLVATAPGSFILAMDIAPKQRLLFEEWDEAANAIEKLIQHINEIQQTPDAYTGDRVTLRGLRKIAGVIKKGVETVQITFREEKHDSEATITPVIRERIEYLLGAPKENERTVQGKLIEINVESNTCKVHPANSPAVDCAYEDSLEDDLISALKQEIEMAGQFIPLDRSPYYRITKIERFRINSSDENEAD